MMRKSFLLFLVILSTHAVAQTPTPLPEATDVSLDRRTLRRVLQGARVLYDSGETSTFLDAAETFGVVESTGEEGEFDLDALRLAEGMSRLQGDDPEAALEAFDRIQGFETPEERSRHRLWKGVAHLKIAASQAENAAWDEAITEAGEAIQSLTQSLKENPDSEPARKHLELAHRHLADYQARKPPPTPTPTPQPTPTPDPEASPTPTPTPTPEPSPTPEGQENSQQEPTPTPESGDQEQQPENSGDEQNEGDPQDQTSGEQDPGEPGSDEEAGGEPSQEEVDAEQARQILDAYLEQEKAMRRQLLQRRSRGIPVEKDW